METVLFTPRLKLTLITTAERGSKELEWLHELRSDEQTTWWSIFRRSKTLEDTEKAISRLLPISSTTNEDKSYRIAYAVHELLPSTSANSESTNPSDLPSRSIGLITLRSTSPAGLLLPPHFFPASTQSSSNTLTVELAYMYLPSAWGKGYGTESISAVFDACKRAQAFWAPYDKVYVRGVVNAENPASQRVMAKIGMPFLGKYLWKGEEEEAVFVAGKWRMEDDLRIFGKFLVE